MQLESQFTCLQQTKMCCTSGSFIENEKRSHHTWGEFAVTL